LLRLHPLVENDIRDIVEYYSEIDAILPQRFRNEFQKVLKLISTFPFLGPVIFDEYRHVTLHVFPYIIIYRTFGSETQVLALVHARRDPQWIANHVNARNQSMTR